MGNNHYMIDIETLGLTPDCAIISIGAVEFSMWPFLFSINRRFESHVSLASNIIEKRVIDQETVNWWQKTDAELFESTLNKCQEPLERALVGLSEFIRAEDEYDVWANGTDFDIVVLTHAYRTVLGQRPPWGYNMVRDCRTIFRLFGKPGRPASVKHDALSDAIEQAKALAESIRIVKVELC